MFRMRQCYLHFGWYSCTDQAQRFPKCLDGKLAGDPELLWPALGSSGVGMVAAEAKGQDLWTESITEVCGRLGRV